MTQIVPRACRRSTTELDNRTVRSVVHTSFAGHAVRVRLTNAEGTQPVTAIPSTSGAS